MGYGNEFGVATLYNRVLITRELIRSAASVDWSVGARPYVINRYGACWQFGGAVLFGRNNAAARVVVTLKKIMESS